MNELSIFIPIYLFTIYISSIYIYISTYLYIKAIKISPLINNINDRVTNIYFQLTIYLSIQLYSFLSVDYLSIFTSINLNMYLYRLIFQLSVRLSLPSKYLSLPSIYLSLPSFYLSLSQCSGTCTFFHWLPAPAPSKTGSQLLEAVFKIFFTGSSLKRLGSRLLGAVIRGFLPYSSS